MWEWAKEHWILSTLLGFTAISAVDTAITKKKPAPQLTPGNDPALDAAIQQNNARVGG